MLRKGYGSGTVLVFNGNPVSKSTYKQLLYNVLLYGMSRKVLFNADLKLDDGLPVPGGEAGIIINSLITIYNLFEVDVT